MKNLTERLKAVIEANTPGRGRFAELEKMSALDIPSDTWKSVWYGRQRPTMEMIELVCQLWPCHALWVATGITEPTSGHEMPGKPGYDLQLGEQREEHIYSKKLLEMKSMMARKTVELLNDPHSDVSTFDEAVKEARVGAWDALRLDSLAKNERLLNLQQDKNGNQAKRKKVDS